MKIGCKNSVGNVGTKWDTKLSGSEGKKDGVYAYFFRVGKSDCNGKGDHSWVENKSIPSTLPSRSIS